MFRIDKSAGYAQIGLGIAPVARGASSIAGGGGGQGSFGANDVGYVYYSGKAAPGRTVIATLAKCVVADGEYYGQTSNRLIRTFGAGYDTGDTITVILDVEATTVAFRKNGTTVFAHEIASAAAFQFAFDACKTGAAVTILEMW